MIIVLKKEAVKSFTRLPTSERQRIVRKLNFLKDNPLLGKPLQGKYKGLFSLRAWPYRIIYRIEKKNVVIYSVAHRQGAYKS